MPAILLVLSRFYTRQELIFRERRTESRFIAGRRVATHGWDLIHLRRHGDLHELCRPGWLLWRFAYVLGTDRAQATSPEADFLVRQSPTASSKSRCPLFRPGEPSSFSKESSQWLAVSWLSYSSGTPRPLPASCRPRREVSRFLGRAGSGGGSPRADEFVDSIHSRGRRPHQATERRSQGPDRGNQRSSAPAGFQECKRRSDLFS